jgi:phosphatidylglycerol---prolipoprotein diacylglyceryl transferase
VNSYTLSVITIGIDPTIELGPATVAWHGLTIAIGIVVGVLVAGRAAEERGFDADRLWAIAGIVAVAGLVGGKALYVLESGLAGEPGSWLSTRGFTFNGGVIGATIAIAVYLMRTGTSLRYLDVVAAGFPLGVAVGRIGDVINGEHYGPASTWLLAVRNTHPDAEVPSAALAYHSGGLYDVLIGLAIFAVVWPARHRFRRPLSAVWTVLALFALGRFFAFFFREDSATLGLGLTTAQLTSIGLLVASVLGYVLVSRRLDPDTPPDRPSPSSPPRTAAT